jgi:GT2 family glycosyltransferase/glycosyltransferase involved in cell wall biosynthesis
MNSMSTIKGYLRELKEQYLKIRATTNWFVTARSVMSFLVKVAPRVLWFFTKKTVGSFVESLSLPDELFKRHRYRTRIDSQVRNVIMLPPINWSFRHQRPQQFGIALAETGRKVLYLEPTVRRSIYRKTFLKTRQIQNVQVATFYWKHKKRYLGVHGMSEIESKEIVEVLERFICRNGYGSVSVIVQQPGWLSVAQRLANNQIVFDCMDHHAGFTGISQSVVLDESNLLRLADAVVVSSEDLLSKTEVANKQRRLIIRNGAATEDFSRVPISRNNPKLVIGYYGAIADWFDIDLVEHVAKSLPNASIELVGHVHHQAVAQRLEAYGNIKFLGEVKYAVLPEVAEKWDVGIIPFLINDLTLATNPVKLYEYAASALPVVSTDLPEVAALAKNVEGIYVAHTPEMFVESISAATKMTLESRQELRNWSKGQSWKLRIEDLSPLLKDEVFVSVVVLMWNNAQMTIDCLSSVLGRSDYGALEVILVDNASENKEFEQVKKWCDELAPGKITVVRNSTNLGFAAGNNVGLRIAKGEFVVILNNDTQVAPGWIHRSLRHFRNNDSLGLLGPSTDHCGNEAMVTMRGPARNWLHEATERFGFRRHKLLPARTVAFFCVFIRREVIEQVGFLDEDFGRGYFEDDDYCRRVELAHFTIGIARDVFVHHEMGSSFNQVASQEKMDLFNRNKQLYESKWGEWIPHVSASDVDAW